MCLDLPIDSNRYVLDECGNCVLKSWTKTNPNNCNIKCGLNVELNQKLCNQCIDTNDDLSLKQRIINSCGRCRLNDSTGCSCDL